MKRFVLIVLVVLFGAAVHVCLAQSGNAGNTGVAFLKLGVGGRASAMGEAYVAVADEATATFWNPAGLTAIQRPQFAFTHTEWLADISNDFLAFAFPALHGTVGISAYTSTVGGIERRTGPTAQPLGAVESNDLAIGLSYAKRFGASVQLGGTVKYLYEKIFIEEANGVAFDLGLTFKPFDSSLRIAAVVQNLGSMGNLREENIELPSTLRVGAAYEFPVSWVEGSLILAADAVKVVENDVQGNFGVEWRLLNRLAFRGGYQTGAANTSFVGGFGLNFSRAHLDYGYKPFDANLGDTHRFSFSFEI